MVMDGCGWFGLPTSESSLGVESALSLVQILEENHRLTPELQIFLGVVLYVLYCFMFYMFLKSPGIPKSSQTSGTFEAGRALGTPGMTLGAGPPRSAANCSTRTPVP